MGVALQQSRLSADEFPAWEATQAERHGSVQGEVFAGDVRRRGEAADGGFHPDARVTCSAADAAAGRT